MDTDAIMREMQASFRVEAEELVTDLEESLLQLESDNTNGPLIDCVFRSLHTLKGSGSSAGFLKLAAFLHIFEDAFNLAREGKMEVTQELIDISLQTVDKITEYVTEEPTDQFDRKAVEQSPILVELRKIMPEDAKSVVSSNTEKNDDNVKEVGLYEISFKPYDNFAEFGNEPITVIDELRGIGKVSLITYSKIPTLETFDPETTYLSWNIKLVSDASEEDVTEIFSFVDMDADIEIKREPRIFDGKSRTEGLFDITTLKDYEDESIELICSIQDSSTPHIETEKNREQWNSIERAFHTFKGNSGILISSATDKVADNHPLRHLEILTEAGQFFAHLTQAETILLNDENRFKIIGVLLNTIRDYYQSFFNSYCPKLPDAKLLTALELDLESFQSRTNQWTEELSPVEEAFKNIFTQSLYMIEGSINSLNESNLSAEYTIIQRAIGNIIRAASRAEKAELKNICTGFENECQENLNKGHNVFKQYCDDLIAKLKSDNVTVNATSNSESETKSDNTATRKKSSTAKPTLRVEEEKIDRLMRAIGELLVARGAFPLIAKNVANDHGLNSVAQELREAGGNVSRLADELQSAVMSIRMRPLQSLFQRFPRMIRDVSKNLGKDINFAVVGEDTELDKAMVEQLGDPLVHILRNSLDHGIETREERAETEKPKTSTITLEAITEGATVAINIKDDGRGLNPNKLKTKALEKGLITVDEARTMPDSVAQELIMRPGFSTAEQVTDLSGRGVGMDVVANNIHKLHGTIEISSELGTGTTITLRLPTSLLISEAILIQSGKEEYLIPMDNVSSLEKLPKEHVRSHCGTRIATIRGEVINLVDLKELLDSPTVDEELPAFLNVALISTSEGQLGLIVNKFIDQEEIVVKALTGELADVRLFSGVSIMGDGRVVPVINAREINNYYLKNFQSTRSEAVTN